MKFLNRDDNVLTLTNDNPERLKFVYKSQKNAVLFAVFAVALSLVVWFYGDEIKKIHHLIYWFCCFLAAAFCFGTIATLWTNCCIEINASKKTVHYSLSTPFEKTEWTKHFNYFKEIRIYRPISGAGNAGHSAFLRILLTTVTGDEIPLGFGMLGVKNKQKARHLAEKLSKMLSLAVFEEPSVD